MGLNKINKPEPLAKTALRILRQSILTNELTTGVIYNEKSIAADLGISRTPVREALLELASKRLVKFLPQKGVIINTFSNAEIDDAFEIRTALELFSIKKICLNYKILDTSQLVKNLAEQKKAAMLKNKLAFMEADRAYHILFSRLTNNKYLVSTMEDIRGVMHLMGLQALTIKGRMQDVIHEHENILNAIAKGDSGKAKEYMKFHLDASSDAVKLVY
jgi:DNA-binding GntR family transcriptional regulator